MYCKIHVLCSNDSVARGEAGERCVYAGRSDGIQREAKGAVKNFDGQDKKDSTLKITSVAF